MNEKIKNFDIPGDKIFLKINGKLELVDKKQTIYEAENNLETVIQLGFKDDIPICVCINEEAEKYKLQKKIKKQPSKETKIIKMSPNIDDRDLIRNIIKIKQYLSENFPCKIHIFYKRGIRRKLNKKETIPERCVKYGIILREVKQKQTYQVLLNDDKNKI